MLTPQVLEQGGAWRGIGILACLAIAVLPTTPLLWETVVAPHGFDLGATYAEAVRAGLLVTLAVATVTLMVGLPSGALAALCRFRGRGVLLALVALPALAPSLLWAIGWSTLAARLGPGATAWLSGYAGTTLVFSATGIPIVLLTTAAAACTLTASQVDAVRLAGGDFRVLVHVCRYALIPASLAAVLAGVLALSDPGPGQILGLRTAAAEILTSFSALYDFALAGRQCLVLAAVVLAVSLLPLIIAAPRISQELLAKQVRRAQPMHDVNLVHVAQVVLCILLVIDLLLPLTGILLSIIHGVDLNRAAEALRRTGPNTMVYALGAGLVAIGLGFALAGCVGRSARWRTFCLAASLVLIAQPPALPALGWLYLSSVAPAWTDPLLRGRVGVCVVLGLRLFPIATVLGLRSWATLPRSWTSVATLHGVPLGTFLRRVVLPFFRPAALAALLLVGMLATADVTTVLLLHPPGEASLPLAIFTVMANAPESTVASLCLVYLLTAGAALGVLAIVIGGRRR